MDQNNLIVYLEIEDGRVADVSLELLTKGRVLAEKLGVKLEAVAVGDNLDTVAEQVFPYGVDRLYRVASMSPLGSADQSLQGDQAPDLPHGRNMHRP